MVKSFFQDKLTKVYIFLSFFFEFLGEEKCLFQIAKCNT